MDKNTAEKLLILVNDEVVYNALQDYVNYRLKNVTITLSTANTIEELKHAQGIYHELSQLQKLKEKVNSYGNRKES